MASLKDIASATGVSVRTVGRALRGDRYVSAETRQRVAESADRLGYRPNRIARSLRARTSGEVPVLLWSLDELSVAKVAAFEQTLRPSEFSVSVLFGATTEQGGWGGLLDELVDRRPAAVAVFGRGQDTMGLDASLTEAGLTHVFLDSDDPVDSVRIDRPRGVQDAVGYLTGEGRRRIAYLGPDDPTRLTGYHAAMDALGREPTCVHLPGGIQWESGYRAVDELLAHRPRLDAVQAFSDEVAMGLLAGLHERGVRVPDDLAVVGFDDRRAASLAYPPLTTVAQPNRRVGEVAAEILLAKIAGGPAPSGGWSQTVPTELVVRQST